MTDTAIPRGRAGRAAGLFPVAVFFSAGLVFLVEPMVAQLLLPRLGGSPAVWNASLAFFQLALLGGYGYAHLLQRIALVRRQMLVHLGVLALGALALPLRLSGELGQSSTNHPVLWLLGVLALSVGAPFAALSATAPLLQAWSARADGEGSRPYRLYAASNLGSLIALVAYPFAVQPLIGLRLQALVWSLGYLAFAALVLVVVLQTSRTTRADVPPAAAEPAPSAWRQRGVWILLAAAPSSLLLGVTAHITADVASVPFLWVPPLALYLLTFVIAFQARPLMPSRVALILQALATPVCLWLVSVRTHDWLPLLLAHLSAFLFTALICHQALAERRPGPARLTEFYLCLALGGVIGGAFNAFLAPVVFNDVWEYPAVLALAGLARTPTRWPPYAATLALLLGGLGAEVFLVSPDVQLPALAETGLVLAAGACAFLLRGRPAAFAMLAGGLAITGVVEHRRYDVTESHRSFFGVVQLGQVNVPELGPVRFMVHGSTVHGAEALDPALRCRPLTYYAPGGPMGQAFASVQSRKPAASFGLVGLGVGTVTTFVRHADAMRIFEIDPLVVRLASDPSKFGYVHGCAKGALSLAIGDARLSLEREPPGRFDLLLIDAFSSDSIPTHLLTTEAMRLYLKAIRPDGVLLLHLSNRNLELTMPAAAAVKDAGGFALTQTYVPPPAAPLFADAGAIVVLAARSPAALEPFRRDPRWRPIDPGGVRAWTDDYSNVLGALVRRFEARR
ncbi:MAG TPA: fused MFS/spermidine synthase [Caulobacteraceae bacterium]